MFAWGIRFMDDAHSTDASLLARMAQRDPRRSTRFIRATHVQYFLSLLAMLGEHARATDLTQDVFLLCVAGAGTYQPTGSARAWLLRLTRNRAIDELRRDAGASRAHRRCRSRASVHCLLRSHWQMLPNARPCVTLSAAC